MAREPFVQQQTAQWIGAAFYWIINGCSGAYAQQLSPNRRLRNVWTGYCIELILFVAVVYLLFIRK